MKNYKIIENRPELNFAQLEQGMDFFKIKSNAALASKTTAIVWSAKTIVLNSIAGAILVCGTIFGVKQYNKEPNQGDKKDMLALQVQEPKANESLKNENAVDLRESFIEKAIITPTKLPVTAVNVDKVTVAEKVKCTIVENYNPYDLHPKLNFPYGLECLGLGCQLHYISYEELTGTSKLLKPVILSIDASKSPLILMTHFANIKLRRGSEILRPMAIGIGEKDNRSKDFKYYSPKFISTGATLKVPKKVDILIFFEDPQVGDQFIFGDISVNITTTTTPTKTFQLSSSSTSVLSSAESVVSNTEANSTASSTTAAENKKTSFRVSENVTFKFMELLTINCFALNKENAPTGITGMDCALGCEFKYIDCDALSQIPYIRVARLTITEPKAKLILKSNFENIKLIHGNKTTHPLAIYIGSTDPTTKQPTFLHKKFRSKRAVLKAENKIEIIMIIEEPIEAGDKLIFDNIRAILVD